MNNTVTEQRSDKTDDLIRIITALTSELIRVDPTNLLATETARHMLAGRFWQLSDNDD